MTAIRSVTDQAPLRRHQNLRADFDLPGVPKGTKGKVTLVNGIGPWIRYRVIFQNGVDLGNLLRDELEA